MQASSSRQRADGRCLTAREIRAGLRLNIVAGSLAMAWVAVAMGMPLTMLFEALGASGMFFGIIGTVQQLAMAVQIPAALYAERLPERKTFWGVLAFCHRALWFIPAFLPLFFCPGRENVISLVLVTAIGLSAVLAHAATAPWHSWMADLVPENQRGRFWSIRQSITMATYLFAMAFSGWMLDAFPSPHEPDGSFAGFAAVFAIATVLGCVDIVIHWFVPEPRPAPPGDRPPVLQRIVAPLRDRDFFWLTFAMGVWYLAIGVVSAYGQIYVKRTFCATYTHLAAWMISAVIGNIVASRLWAYVIDRIGARTFGAIAMIAGPLLASMAWFLLVPGETTIELPGLPPFTMPKAIAILTLGGLIGGGLYSGVNLAQYNLLGTLAPQQGRTMAMAVHWTIVGVLGGIGPLLGGVVMDGYPSLVALWNRLCGGEEGEPVAMLPFGVPFDYIHLLVILHMVLCAFAAPLLLRIQRPGNLPVGTALSRLLVINPLRVMSSIYNIYMLTSATSVDERARAARELGEQRTAIAVRDLIDRLDDPASEVREEAALALGRIGSSEAIDALLQKLQDPCSDISPQIARALRETPDPRSVAPLVNRLYDPDREMRAEAARTLGVIGDRRAAPSLLEILRESCDDRVVSASCEALARLGEIAAIYEILPRLRAARNPVLRRSLAVAVGDLLGRARGEFYRILRQEEAEYGSEVANLIRNLCRSIRHSTSDSLTAQGEALAAKALTLRTAYDERQFQRCADLMFELAIGLAAFKHGVRFGGNAEVLIEDLIFRDEKFAVGVWYLHLLRENPQIKGAGSLNSDMMEVLLGIYFLGSHALGER